MTSFAHLPPPRSKIIRRGVYNGAGWMVLLFSTIWNGLNIGIGMKLHHNQWVASFRHLTLVILIIASLFVLLGCYTGVLSLDVMFHRKKRWISFATLWIWLTPMCIGVNALWLGKPTRRSILVDIGIALVLARVVRFFSPLLASKELDLIKSKLTKKLLASAIFAPTSPFVETSTSDKE